MIWAGSDLKPGNFLFPDCLDLTKENPGMQGRFPSHLRMSEKAFLHNNFINSETGYTPHQLVYGSTSGLPGILQLPRNADTVLGGSIYSKLCENKKNYKSAYPGSNKVAYGACEQESEEKKFKILIFECAKLDFCKKKLLVQKKIQFF